MQKNKSVQLRKNKIRQKIKSIKHNYRLTIFRSNNRIYCQIIDDNKGKTICQASSQKSDKNNKKTKIAYNTGKNIADLALKNNIKEVVFDRGSYKYHGRVKALADGARENGLKF